MASIHERMEEGEPRFLWDDLRIFLAVARRGTLSAAASDVGLSQPTLGRRIQALEARVGQPLFQRTRAGFSPTEEGLVVLAHAEGMEEEMLALERRLQGRDTDLQGALRVSSSEWFARHVLTPVFVPFAAKHPMVTLEVLADTRLLSLDRREADLVFRFRPFDEVDVVQRRVTHVHYGLYASASYVEQHGVPRAADGGVGHRLVAMDSAFGSLADVVWLTKHLPEARFALRSNSRDVQADACRAGVGLAVLPRVMGRAMPLQEITLGEAPPGRDIWMGYHPDLGRFARLRALIEHVTGAIGAES
jgi:DNA-binding transcriptional LysR family regulator